MTPTKENSLNIHLANKSFNHWNLNYPSSNEITNRQILEFTAKFFSENHDFFKSPYNPVVYWKNVETKQKEKTFVSKKDVYSVESKKTMDDTKLKEWEGNSKTGRRVTALSSEDSPLLLFKNSTNHSFDAVETDIKIALDIANTVPNTQKLISVLRWVTRKNNQKTGYICLEQKTNLYKMVAQEANIPKPLVMSSFHRKSLQLQMAQALKTLSSQGYLYRDCKLENFLLSSDSKTITLIDFDLCSKELIEPALLGGTPVYLPPEYALLMLLKEQGYTFPNNIINLFVNEKNTVFSLGITFLVMDFYASPARHLLPLIASNDGSVKRTMLVKSLWVPLPFRNALQKQDPKILQNPFPYVNPIQQEKRPPQKDAWIDLLEKMVALDPSERLTLAEVEQEILKVLEKETEERDRKIDP
jgi:hypothetical protein